jgi:thioredoxin-like negative regulator of GroEL
VEGRAAADVSAAGSARAAAQKAMVLAQRFEEAASDLIAVLAGNEASRVADTEHAKLLEALTFNGFYDDVFA